MSLKIVKKLIPVSKYAVKSYKVMKPTRIVVHNTANDASALNEISYMTSNNLKVSFHYAVDDLQAVQGIPENRTAWHAGDNLGKGNMGGIAIEICYSKSGGNKFTKSEKNAVLLIVDILKRYKWNITKVTKHQDYSGKNCPHRTLELGWDRFLKMIKTAMKPPVVTPPIIPTPPVVPQPPLPPVLGPLQPATNDCSEESDKVEQLTIELNNRDLALKAKILNIENLNKQLRVYERWAFIVDILNRIFPVKE